MKRRQSKEVYNIIDNYISRQAVVDSNEFTEYISTVIEPPEYNEMITDYCRKIANNRIRRKRDEDGLRSFFSNSDKINPKYVNVNNATTANLNDIQKALKVQEFQKAQLEKNIIKLANRSKVIGDQITLDEVLQSEETKELVLQ